MHTRAARRRTTLALIVALVVAAHGARADDDDDVLPTAEQLGEQLDRGGTSQRGAMYDLASRADAVPALSTWLGNARESRRVLAAVILRHHGPRAAAATAALTAALTDPAADVRSAAAHALGAIGATATPATTALAAALEDPEVDVRWAAAIALGRIGPGAAAAARTLASVLADPAAEVAYEAARALARIGEPAIDATAARLATDPPQAARWAAWALAQIGPPALAALTRAAARGSQRRYAIEALGWIEGDAAGRVPALLAALDANSPDVRLAAIELLGCLGGRATGAVPRLERLLRESTPAERELAAWALGRIGPATADGTTALSVALTDPAQAVRLRAAAALGTAGSRATSAVAALVAMLGTASEIERRAAAAALGEIGAPDPTAVTALADALAKDRDPSVRRAAAEALAWIGPGARAAQAAVERAIAADRDPDVCSAAADALVEIREETERRAADRVPLPVAPWADAAAVRDPDPATRRAALRALAVQAAPDAAARDAIIAAARDPDAGVADEARLTLAARADRGPPGDADWLRAYREADERGRKALLNGVYRLGPDAAATVAGLLEDADPAVRRTAVKMLGGMARSAGCIPRLAAALGDDDATVREAAAEALMLQYGGQWYPQVAADLRVDATSTLVEHLTDPRPERRRIAARLLWPIGYASWAGARDAVRRAFADPDVEVRRAAVESVGFAAAPRDDVAAMVGALTTALADADAAVRGRAADALERYGLKAASAVPALIRVLSDDASAVRRSAANTLAAIGPGAADAAAALRNLRSDGAPDVRAAAARAWRFVAPRTLDELIGDLAAYDDEEGSPTIAALIARGAVAVPPLVAQLRARTVTGQTNAARALGDLGELAAEAVPDLVTALTSSDDGLHYTAESALAKLGPTAAAGLARALRGDRDPAVRQAIGRMLADRPELARLLIPALVSALNDPDPAVRHRAILAFPTDNDPPLRLAVVRAITRTLDDPESEVNDVSVLSNWGRAAIASALEATRSPHPHVRQAALSGLGRLGGGIREDPTEPYYGCVTPIGPSEPPEPGMPLVPAAALVHALDDPDRDVRLHALWAVQSMLDGEVYDVSAPPVPPRRLPAELVTALPALEQMVRSTDGEIREAATRALGRLCADRPAGTLVFAPLLRRRNPAFAADGAAGLAAMGPHAATLIPALMHAVATWDGQAQSRAIEALGAIGSAAAPGIPVLREALCAPLAETRGAAASALGRIGAGAVEAVPDLVALLRSEDESVAQAAAEALGELGEPIGAIAAPRLAEGLRTARLRNSHDAFTRALGRMGVHAAPAIPDLVRALDEMGDRDDGLPHDPAGHPACVALLALASAPEMPAAMLEALAHPNRHVRETAARVLARIGPSSAPALTDALSAWQPYAVCAAARSLRYIGPAAAPAAAAALRWFSRDHPDANVRREAMRALQAIGPK